jgi:hypothetical protein
VQAAVHTFQVQSQGDQIGRIFAYGAIFFFGHFLKNYRSRQNFGLHFRAKSNAKKKNRKNRWATFWVIFFTNSSGRPVPSLELTNRL